MEGVLRADGPEAKISIRVLVTRKLLPVWRRSTLIVFVQLAGGSNDGQRLTANSFIRTECSVRTEQREIISRLESEQKLVRTAELEYAGAIDWPRTERFVVAIIKITV
jgi:hypothetical protein